MSKSSRKINIKVKVDIRKGWKLFKYKQYSLLFKGYLSNLSLQRLLERLVKSNFDQRKSIKLFKELDGHFSIVFFNNKNFIFGCDRICSIPLIYNYSKNNYFIADNFTNIMNIINQNFKPLLNPVQSNYFAMSGFTFGQNSLFKEMNTTHPGNFYILKDTKFKITKYYDWQPFKNKNQNKRQIKVELKKINNIVIDKLIKSSEGRCVAVPLSAGYDSRFILSGLIEKGYKNIFAFSYGRKNNRDKVIAERIAKYLNLPWVFIEYDNKIIKEIMLSKDYIKFKKFSDVTNSIHFPQDFFALQYLKKNKVIPINSLIVNGQTGDFISGNHIPPHTKNDDYDILIIKFLLKHFKMSNKLLADNKPVLVKELKKRISLYDIDTKSLAQTCGALEKIEYEDRQSKYVMSGQRSYEYFNYEWRLPLWDKEYLNFWEKVDVKYKIHQNLYKEVLIEQNWADIWKKFPLNPKPSFSFNLTIIRFFFKCLFFSLGKEKWHRFEMNYLDYYLTTLCGYAIWNYGKVILDKRGFTSPLSWHIEEYFKDKGINWDGTKKK